VTKDVIPPATLPSLPDDPFGTEVLTDPYEFHHRLRGAGPVVSLPRYGLLAMGVAFGEEVVEVRRPATPRRLPEDDDLQHRPVTARAGRRR